MRCSEAKQIVQDGDIIFVHGHPYNLIQALIMFFTGSRFSHCCIAFHVNIAGYDRIVVVEAQGYSKRRIIPLSFYSDFEITVVAAPQQWEQIKDNALRDVGRAKYNILRAVYIGICEFVERRFHKRLPQLQRHDEICSEFCSDVYQLNVDGSPQAVYEALMNISQER